MPGALDGIRVLDFTQMMLGPYATQLLGDLGADVIKVERPKTGEWERGLAMTGELVGGVSAAFLAMNRNKRSVAVDLKDTVARDALLAIGRTCDVVVENFRPGVMARLGLGYDDFKAVKSDIIYCSGSGWGQGTPMAREGRPGQDLLIQAYSGLAFNNGRRDDPPMLVASSVVDASTALTLAAGVLAALVARERQGVGQWVQVDLFSTAMSLQCQEISALSNQSARYQRSASGVAAPWLSAPCGVYRTRDGWVALAMADPSALAQAVGDPALADLDPWVERDEVKERLDALMTERNTDEWLGILLPAGLWAAPVRTNVEAVEELRAQASSLLCSVLHPEAGKVELIGCPVSFSETPWRLRLPPPTVGQHTEEVLSEVLSAAEAKRLAEAGRAGPVNEESGAQ